MLKKQQHLIKDMDSIMIDGQFLVKMFHFFFGIKVKRRSFDMTSMAPIVFGEAEESNQKVYLIGSDEDSIKGAVGKFQKRYPKMNICGFRNGYLRSQDERQEAIETILSSNTEIVVVGMGTPRQEQFLVDLKNAGYTGTGYTCGGFFHQTASLDSSIDYYPKWADKYHLRWLYRIYDEPKLFKRYTIDYSWFLLVFMYDLIQYKLFKR